MMFERLWTKFKENIPARNKQIKAVDSGMQNILNLCERIINYNDFFCENIKQNNYQMKNIYKELFYNEHFSLQWHKNLIDMNAMDEKETNIAYICDNNYAYATAVSISSLVRNRNKNTKYKIHIINDVLSDKSRDAFKIFGDAVSLITVKNIYQDIASDHHYVSKSALLKFLIPNVVEKCKKILYLDSDVIINNDLSKFYNEDIEDFYAAVVKDYAATIGGCHKIIKTKNYFNSGVMLLNLHNMRKDRVSIKLCEVKRNLKYDDRFQDQDTFNKVFGDNVKYMNPKYNMMYANIKDFDWKDCSDFYNLTYKEWLHAIENPTIFHFTNNIKPWETNQCPRFFEYYKEELIYNAAMSL